MRNLCALVTFYFLRVVLLAAVERPRAPVVPPVVFLLVDAFVDFEVAARLLEAAAEAGFDFDAPETTLKRPADLRGVCLIMLSTMP